MSGRDGLENCDHCGEPLGEDGDHGLISNARMHRECTLRCFIGGLNHLLGRCSCCVPGGAPPDPPGLTKRQAAIAAVAYWERRERTLRALARRICHEAGIPWHNPDTGEDEQPPETKRPAQGGPK